VVLFLKALFCGFVAAIGAWGVVLCFWMWRLSVQKKRMGIEGLGAVAGGWTFLVHSPLVAVLLALAFGLGFYLAGRLAGGGL
jgi:hypothetical protein